MNPNSEYSAEDSLRDLIHMTSDELPGSPDFSRVVNEDALTPEVVDLIGKLESFQ